ncbi:transglycosylase family protein [Streptomyces sp. PKU-EA00015]|uniref:LysM peptidoglycan-binding domain-containing protein n=1 Tax=Streptomyces sp. PKU-EA00015 TaxID=2748326 RepID=UPI0015A3B3C4|nr:transglycosylase family protein [Streptomyces sp. PKU-EA00015]NWF29905.1 transglycosylase family protein [Streptomyces sp. PKU-EA00015]
MRSGNGRHRRPRQAPAIVVAAGVTGSAIALPLLGAGSASAADAATWDRVAECESSGMWSADLGNGFYGGLQLSQQTWEEFGGTAYAPSADLASRSQQIAVAEKVLDAQGPDAWQACAPIAGLTNDDASTGVDPGDLLPLPDASADAGTGASADTRSDEGAPADSGDADAGDPAADASDGSRETPAPDASTTPTPEDGDAQASPAPSADTDGAEASDPATGAGRHRGEPAPDDAETGIEDKERESGRHASRGDTTARDGVTEGASDGTYTVQPGDTLWAIADEREVPGGWGALYEANEKTVGADPDLILPGQSLDLGLNGE